jgi:coiled-coil domain-containing protein 39
MERTAFELQDRLNITQNSIFRGNERMDAFKLQMNWNQEEMEQWAVAARQKEEDNLALQKYARQDESKIKEMSLAIEKLTRATSTRESELEAEMTETLSAQVLIDFFHLHLSACLSVLYILYPLPPLPFSNSAVP